LVNRIVHVGADLVAVIHSVLCEGLTPPTVLRAVLWRRWALGELLCSYGTAGGSFRMLCRPEQAFLPGWA
jgi:hypothetical protein